MSDIDHLLAGDDGKPVPESKVPDMDEPIVSNAEKRGLSREQAIEEGKRAAKLECEQLARRLPDIYTKERCAERIERAGAYAAWEYDGRMAGTIGRRR